MKNVEMATKAFVKAGEKKARESFAKSRLSKVPTKLKSITRETRTLFVNDTELKIPTNIDSSSAPSVEPKNVLLLEQKKNSQFHESSNKKLTTRLSISRHKQRKTQHPVPSFTDSNKIQKKGNRSTVFDNRKSSFFNHELRRRTPGSIVYTVNESGESKRETS